MKIAIVGSRGITNVDVGRYVEDGDEIVSGGAIGVDRLAREYAQTHGHALTEFLPDYARYGRAAPILRNQQIVEYADRVVVFWDGTSRGAASVIRYAKDQEKPCEVVITK